MPEMISWKPSISVLPIGFAGLGRIGIADKAAVGELVDRIEVEIGVLELLDGAGLVEVDIAAHRLAGVGAGIIVSVGHEELRLAEVAPLPLDAGTDEPRGAYGVDQSPVGGPVACPCHSGES